MFVYLSLYILIIISIKFEFYDNSIHRDVKQEMRPTVWCCCCACIYTIIERVNGEFLRLFSVHCLLLFYWFLCVDSISITTWGEKGSEKIIWHFIVIFFLSFLTRHMYEQMRVVDWILSQCKIAINFILCDCVWHDFVNNNKKFTWK